MSAINQPDEAIWRPLLQAALDRHNGNKKAVADELGCSRTAVSLVVAGKYHAPLHAFGQRVINAYDRWVCPWLGEPISRNQCRDHAEREAPTSSPREVRHWRHCQSCQFKPETKGVSE